MQDAKVESRERRDEDDEWNGREDQPAIRIRHKKSVGRGFESCLPFGEILVFCSNLQTRKIPL